MRAERTYLIQETVEVEDLGINSLKQSGESPLGLKA